MKTLGVLVLVVLAGQPACHSPVAPEKGPRRGIPNATILQNVAFFRAHEAASGRDSILVALGGISPLAGTTCPDGYWWYRFAERPSYRLHDWQIACGGYFGFLGATPDALRLDMTEIGTVLALDSPDVIRVAKENGGQNFLDRYPQARVRLLGRFIGRRPVWEVEFSTSGTPCGFSAVIDGQTGELLLTSQPCP